MDLSRVSRTLIAALIAIIFTGLAISRARADVGLPPVNPSGSSLTPDQQIQTNVRMVSEQVDLTIEPYERSLPSNQIEDNPGYWMRVLVDAQFVMRNLGEAPEAFDVWFPLATTTKYPDYLLYETTQNPERAIQDFRVHVDGKPVATQQVSGPILNLLDREMPPELSQEGSPWATFPVTFPPGQDVLIRVRYTLYPGGRRPFGDIEYILQTGSGWRDTIGEATITAHLPDPVTPESVSLGSKDIFGDPLAPQPPGYTVEGDTITWHFTNLEPTAQDNIYLNVLEPQRYERLLQARRKVEQADPSTPVKAADAYLELARSAREAVLIIKDVTRNGGGRALAQEANAAYERAIELNPDVPSVYSEYARWLLSTGGWRDVYFNGICPQELCELVQRGLEKFPQDAELQQIDAEIKDNLSMHQTEVAYATQDAAITATALALETLSAPSPTPQPTLTPVPASPTALPTALPTRVAPSATAQPSPAASPSSAPDGGGGACPGGLIPLIGLGIIGIAPVLKRHR
jgi:tetratricopeptide (TPR) repeat protein